MFRWVESMSSASWVWVRPRSVRSCTSLFPNGWVGVLFLGMVAEDCKGRSEAITVTRRMNIHYVAIHGNGFRVEEIDHEGTVDLDSIFGGNAHGPHPRRRAGAAKKGGEPGAAGGFSRGEAHSPRQGPLGPVPVSR